MTPQELMADVPLGPGERHDVLLGYCLLLRYLADHVYYAQLESGVSLSDPINQRQFFHECAEALIAMMTGKKEAPKPGYNVDFCPNCGHVHVDDHECSFPIGGGRVCRCERQVTA